VTEYLRARDPISRRGPRSCSSRPSASGFDRVLDLGCGDGRLMALVLARSPGASGAALDVSEAMLVRARRRLAGAPVELLRHDLGAALPDLGSFDAVVSGLAIHHVEDARKQALFAEVLAALRPGRDVRGTSTWRARPTAVAHERFRTAISCLHDDPGTGSRRSPTSWRGWRRPASRGSTARSSGESWR